MSLTYEDFQAAEVSEKVGLVQMEVAEQLVGFVVHSGTVFRLNNFLDPVVVSLAESGTLLTEVATLAAVVPGTWFHDRVAQVLYVEMSDSTDPNPCTNFTHIVKMLFFSNVGIALPNDLASGFDVYWEPLLKETSQFGVELDHQEQFGTAIEGKGRVTFHKEQEFWEDKYDKLTFENQRVFIFSTTRALPASEAKLIYRGRVQTKSWTATQVAFTLKDFLNELRPTIDLPDMRDFTVITPVLTEELQIAKQRRIYGFRNFYRPTPIDGFVDGITITGTVSIANNTTTVTGVGTLFLKEISPGDELLINGTEDSIAVKEITSNTALELEDDFELEGGASGAIATLTEIIHPKQFINRSWLIAGHSLREPTTTVTSTPNARTIIVGDNTDFEAGDRIFIGTTLATVANISTGNLIKLTFNLNTLPSVGTTVIRLTVQVVRINDRALTFDRDYTYDATTALLTLDEDAEKNIAKVRSLTGSLSLVTGLRTVTGTGTLLRTEVAPGDFISVSGQVDFFEILQVVDDTNLILREVSTFTDALKAGRFKKAVTLDEENEDVLNMDVIGKTKNGIPTGDFIKTGPELVQDLLIEAGLSSELNATSFTDTALLAPAKVGLSIPEEFNASETPTIRDVINLVNRSIFGSLFQNKDFQLEYDAVSPRRLLTDTRVREADVLSFTIRSKSNKIIRAANVLFNRKEFEAASKAPTKDSVKRENKDGRFLANVKREKEIDTILIDSAEADCFAQRWAYLLQHATSTIEFKTKMQLARVQQLDRVDFEHQKIYERIGSSGKRKVAGIQSIRKNHEGVTVSLEDLGNAYSAVATITTDDANNFDNASQDEKFAHGFITNEFGTQGSTPDSTTFGINRTW